MKNIPFLFLLLSLCIACEKQPSQLDIPRISYTVNGEKVYSEDYTFSGGLRSKDYVNCDHYYGGVQFVLFQPAVGSFPVNSLTFNDLLVVYDGEMYSAHLDAGNASTIVITEFDETHRKASGTFYFEGRCITDSTKTLTITDGEFNDFYFPDSPKSYLEQYGQLNYFLNDRPNYLYHVYGHETGGNKLMLQSYLGASETAFTVFNLPLEYGVQEISALSDVEITYSDSQGNYSNILPGTFFEIVSYDYYTRVAEIHFTINLADADGNELHFTDGYARIYY